MLPPLYLGVLHAVEPDHVTVVTGVSLAGKGRGAWMGAFFGLGITAMFTLLSAVSGWVAARFSPQFRFRRALYALSDAGNVAVGLYLLFKA